MTEILKMQQPVARGIMRAMSHAALPPTASRLGHIARARQLLLHDGAVTEPGTPLVEPWIARSWQRCLALGLQPGQRVAFEPVSEQAMRRTADSNHQLVQAARPVLAQLAQALAETRYFAILTNHQGVVVQAAGPIDPQDRRATLITRIGVDLSEHAVGTTAIGAALDELHPVWLHRGEHFFSDTSVYSCAGAPLFGPDGSCIGMLDLTGIEAMERPELRHLAAHAAHRIEDALLLQRPHRLLLRLNWPGMSLGGEADGILTLDADGCIVAANRAARQLLPMLASAQMGQSTLHARELFALPWETLFDAARQGRDLDVPLWSSLRLQVRTQQAGAPISTQRATPTPSQALRDVETTLIRQAVQEARGNVAEAARRLGISRATVYRKLGSRRYGS